MQPNDVDLFTFQTINSARADSLSLKYLRCTPSGSIDIGIGKFEFVAKSQFLLLSFWNLQIVGPI